MRHDRPPLDFPLLLTLLTIALLWRPLCAGEAFFWGTPLLQFVPWQRLAAEMWRGGHLPLWNPLVGCGAPLAANYQTAAFYPLNLLHLLLPAEVALTWTTAFHLLLAGWGMYRWGRAVGLAHFPASVGGLALAGSGFLVARLALFPSMVLTFAWIPVWLWRGELLIRRGRLADSLWLGTALGLGLLAGHAQTATYGGMLLAVYLLFRMAAGRVNRVPGLLLALLLGLGLASVQLLPTAELLAQSHRAGGVDYDFAMTYSLWPWRLLTFAAPDLFGNPGRGDYWGYANYWEGAGYVGLLPLLLAFAAVTRRRPPSGGLTAFWGATAALALLLALGKNTPLFPFLFRYVPGFDLFQAPARYLAIVTVALAALAALGASRWPQGRRGRHWGRLGVVVGAALLLGGWAAPRLVPGLKPTFAPATARLGLTLALAGLLTTSRRRTPRWQTAVLGFIALDLLLAGLPLTPTVSRSLYAGRAATSACLPADGTARLYWPTDPTHRRRAFDAEQRVKFSYLTFDSFGPRDAAHWRRLREMWLPNVGMLDGVATVNNFDPLRPGRYADLLEAAVDTPALVRLMEATYVVSDRDWPGGEILSACPLPDAHLYRLPDALGRAWIVPQARVVPADETLAALADPAFDPAAAVLLDLDGTPISPTLPSSTLHYALTLQDTPNRVT
ncbi:MAG TPA: hypothetical protein ENK17_02155, partial [Anaerolineae bacterium]|nr:hypothetical protein [Anaerolineae bacterium]